ncbi:hypothetical protein [Vibrio phage phiKT1024]|nr:hypothetical protein [Vibrio phage phiKT1024]
MNRSNDLTDFSEKFQKLDSGFNSEFLQRASQVTTFNLNTSDLTTTKHKREIRHLIDDNWFPDIENTKVYRQGLDKIELNKAIEYLKTQNNEGFKRLYSYNMKGIGPGEMMLYYMVDGAIIGGGSSSGVDLIVGKHNYDEPSIIIDSEEYEIKAVKSVSNKVMDGKFLHDFKLGGTVNISDLMTRLRELGGVTKNELPGSKVNALRDNPEFLAIEADFRKEAYKYFNNHKIIFIDNSPSRMGQIINIGKIEADRIFIERMTSGTIKPLIKI